MTTDPIDETAVAGHFPERFGLEPLLDLSTLAGWPGAACVPDREALAKSLDRIFGSYLAHEPGNPAVFWTSMADDVLAAIAPAPADRPQDEGRES